LVFPPAKVIYPMRERMSIIECQRHLSLSSNAERRYLILSRSVGHPDGSE
jgi:hypothetical protein